MDSRKFNRDMGSYLSSRRKSERAREKYKPVVRKPAAGDEDDMAAGAVVEYRKPGFFAQIFARREAIEERGEDLTPEEKRKLLEMEGDIEGIEEEIEEIEEMEEELIKERDSLLDKFLGFLGFGVSSYEDDVHSFDADDFEEVSAIGEDMKQVLKVLHVWLERLPKKVKKEFKESDDFIMYKEILVRHGLIKVRGQPPAIKPKPEPKEKVEPVEETPKEHEVEEFERNVETSVEETEETSDPEDVPLELEEIPSEHIDIKEAKKPAKKKKSSKKK